MIVEFGSRKSRSVAASVEILVYTLKGWLFGFDFYKILDRGIKGGIRARGPRSRLCRKGNAAQTNRTQTHQQPLQFFHRSKHKQTNQVKRNLANFLGFDWRCQTRPQNDRAKLSHNSVACAGRGVGWRFI